MQQSENINYLQWDLSRWCIIAITDMSFLQKTRLLRKSSATSLKWSKSTETGHIPSVKSLPLVSGPLLFLRTSRGTRLHEYIDVRHKNLGSIFKERLDGKTDLIFISDPEMIKSVFINYEGKYPVHILPEPWMLYEKLKGSKRGLFFMNGEEWLDNRRIMNKYLLKDNTEEWIYSPIRKAVDDFIADWEEKAQPSYAINDLESELYKFSINVIITILLGESPAKFSNHYDELITMFSMSVKRIFQTTTALYGLPLNFCQKFNLKIWRDFECSVDYSLFLAQKLVNEILHRKMSNNGLIDKLLMENVSDDTITKIVADLIIAAGDTTTYTTLWVLFLLSKNCKVIAEIRYKERSFVKFVVQESMRLYPVAPFLTRILPRVAYLGRYQIQEKTPVIASIYTLGRDEEYFSKANQFLPYRWNRTDNRKDSLANHTPTASLPFALGVRSCIGKKIAMTQLTEIISQVVEKFDFKCTNTHVNAITSQILIPDTNIKLVINARNK